MIKCTKCGSDDTIKVSQLYSKSTQTINAQTTGGGIGVSSSGRLGIAGGTASTTGTIQTVEGQMLAPPTRPSNVKLGCLVYFIFFLLYMFVLNPMILSLTEKDSSAHTLLSFLIIIGGIVAVSMWASNRTKSELQSYQTRQEQWDKKWTCNRCGNIFIPES
jgi:hypothetical protein